MSQRMTSSRRTGGRARALLGLLLLSLAGACGPGGSGAERRAAPIPGVEAVQARHGRLPLVQRLSGVVRARNQVGIYSQIEASVSEVTVSDGDIVAAGQVLVRLRDREFQDRLRQAQAGLKIARAQVKQAAARSEEANSALKRARELAATEGISQARLEAAEAGALAAEADLDLARARVEQAEANLAEEESNLDRTTLRAPVAGSIGDRDVEVGMLVDSGSRLFTLGRLDSVSVEVVLTDRMLARIEEGQRAELDVPGHASAPHEARLSRISPFLNPITHSTEGEIDVANPAGRLKPGMFVSVDIFYGESEEATLVPLSALYEQPATGVSGIYASDARLDELSARSAGDDGSRAFSAPVTFRFVPVEVVATGRMEAGIRGVEPGNWVVTLGQHLLSGESSEARVRPVDWDWVLELQNLQREDLIADLMKRESSAAGAE